MGSSPYRRRSIAPSRHLEGAVADEDERPLVRPRQLGANRGRDGKAQGGVEGRRQEVTRLVDRQVDRGEQGIARIGDDDQPSERKAPRRPKRLATVTGASGEPVGPTSMAGGRG